jgi:hypothetical protein
VAPFPRAGRELCEQAGLADSGFAAQPRRSRWSALYRCKRTIEYAELVAAPYECRLRRGHEGSVAWAVAASVTHISLRRNRGE